MKIARKCVCCDGGDLARNPAVLAPFVANRVFGWEPAEVTSAWGLRDIGEGRAYSVCNSLVCGDCGLIFLDMRFDDEEMSALYAGYRGADYCATRERFEPGYAARNALLQQGAPYIPVIEEFLTPHLPTQPRILDWGGDTGVNTPLRGRAAAHHVYDISDQPTVAGALRVEREVVLRENYDLIVLSQVLEHVPDPRAILAELVAAMRPQTRLYVEVPHEDLVRLRGAGPAALKRHWHEHVNFFTPEALDRLHAGLGLEIVARASHEVVAGGRGDHVFSILSQMTSHAPDDD